MTRCISSVSRLCNPAVRLINKNYLLEFIAVSILFYFVAFLQLRIEDIKGQSTDVMSPDHLNFNLNWPIYLQSSRTVQLRLCFFWSQVLKQRSLTPTSYANSNSNKTLFFPLHNTNKDLKTILFMNFMGALHRLRATKQLSGVSFILGNDVPEEQSTILASSLETQTFGSCDSVVWAFLCQCLRSDRQLRQTSDLNHFSFE